VRGRHDTQLNDNQHIGTQHNDALHNNTEHNDTEHNDTVHIYKIQGTQDDDIRFLVLLF